MVNDERLVALRSTRWGMKKGKIWIDLDNSPHVPFFRPIVNELEELGYPVVLTARDCFQVRELVDLFKLRCVVIGRHYGKHKLAKVAGTCFRALQLTSLIRNEKVSLAVAHGSRSQVIAASLLGIRSFSLVDYEFAKRMALIRPDWLMVPAVIPDSAIPYDLRPVLKYQGIKEDVYVPSFRPDPGIRTRLGLTEDDFVVTARPPADEAHYHNPESDELFRASLEFLAVRHDARIVLLPRSKKQGTSARGLWPRLFAERKMIIPEHAVDGLSLLWSSDLAISGGGTMNREAAALGVPVYSVFRGRIGAVDRYLAQRGRLTLLETIADVHEKILVSKKTQRGLPDKGHSNALNTIIDNLVAVVETGKPSQKVAA